ncbi:MULTISPECIES: zinc ribbon domain-containing protein [Haloarcula]|uniref:Zinc ribbon domain-containing protein n=1 Tax=Haloarcula pellucida TaxID=1427151 RepID=A0A830GGF0_9EURY|nr:MULTISPECIES: zinc ribbon domain-containing protein [Halomicroarcula]MBX0346711.1 zinc ribbon domain-containing protein [Halomicroarcula pellucida]MDS0277432.1 zinc ribbon domain-containing protein [Halomicroarcula sp. S1AR25-4]GGN85148.1 zinc ribbon domain-containing protein [Halomicroarcula pellucida]
MTDTGRKRPWLAATLALLYPGLGHVYLREWLRAVLWFGLVVSTSTLLIGDEVVAPLQDGFTVDNVLAVSEALPVEVAVALLAIRALSMADAYLMATRENEATEIVAGAKCPNCGKELDEDIDFCHWCTTELDRPQAGAEQ